MVNIIYLLLNFRTKMGYRDCVAQTPYFTEKETSLKKPILFSL